MSKNNKSELNSLINFINDQKEFFGIGYEHKMLNKIQIILRNLKDKEATILSSEMAMQEVYEEECL